jgi:phosphoribosylformylglycinamidine cyclo-ligase
MHAAVGSADWFADEHRARELVAGFAEGCRAAGAVWGGGETPALRGLIEPGAIVLAGSAVGRISPKSLRIVGDVSDGDAIIFLASSGVQTNGLTLCRKIAESLPGRYATRIEGGVALGEALLAPSTLYVAFVRECQRRGVRLNYAAHVTGHGWRKLMRLEEPFVYEITAPRPQPAIFRFLMEAGPVAPREAYATFNMGIGFAVYVAPGAAAAALEAAKASGYDAWVAGKVRRDGGRKAVSIPSLGLEFDGDTLQVR